MLLCVREEKSMNQILKIDGYRILIGMEDGSVKEVLLSDLDFDPKVGDQVRVYFSSDEVFVRKVNIEDEIEYIKTNGFVDEFGEYDLDRLNEYDLDEFYYTETPGKSLVNKWIYVLLAFFLGGLGFHKFYSKKIFKGVLYLLFSWTFIPSIIGFVESIIGLTKESDLDGNILM